MYCLSSSGVRWSSSQNHLVLPPRVRYSVGRVDKPDLEYQEEPQLVPLSHNKRLPRLVLHTKHIHIAMDTMTMRLYTKDR